MPVLSCGGMRYQYKWQDTPLDQIPPGNQANLEATIRRAMDLGINHIETARGYGSSERQLGLILPKYPREKLIVQTKCTMDKDPDVFTRNVEESLARLGLNYVDLLGLHGINDAQQLAYAVGDDGKSGCLAAARTLQKRGLVRHVGFSTHAPLPVLLQAIRQQANGGFDYVNLHWYYIFQRNWPAIEEATRRDMGVFIISPSDKGGLLYKPSARFVELCAPLHPIAFNNLFCLARPEVHTLSIGAARPTDFDAHVESLPLLEKAGELLAPILKRLQAAIENAVPAPLRNPFALTLPEWNDTPGQVNVPVILWLRTLVKAFDLKDYAQMRYNLLGNGGHWFPGLNAGTIESVDLAALEKATGLGTDLKPLLRETHDLLWKEPVKRLSQS
jgi:predicted aldo/keto reductase-like oxidoreductase